MKPENDKNTVRVDDATINSGINLKETVRVDTKTIKSEPAKQTVKATSSNLISSGLSPSIKIVPGKPLQYEFNGQSYKLVSKISDSSTEAEIFLMQKDEENFALKLYYPFVKPKLEIVKKLRELVHPDILSVIDFGYFNDRFFEILPYADQGSLAEKLPIKEIPRLKSIIQEIINALKYCHENGIIHRDIKPSNIFVNSKTKNDVLVGDFGIASLVDKGEELRRTSIFQTPIYAAPEYKIALRGETYITKAVDYYALGITIWELWSGILPPANMDDLEFLRLMFEGTPPIPTTMDENLSHLIKGLTTRDYKKRWGFDEVSKWLKGQFVPVHIEEAKSNYNVFEFGEDKKGNLLKASSPKELAKLIYEYPNHGRKLLYRGLVSEWLKKSGNRKLFIEIADAVEYKFKNNEEAGTIYACYLLDTKFPFYSTEGQPLRNKKEFIVELESNYKLYQKRLQDQNDRFYLYLLSKNAEKDVELFRNYFKNEESETALFKVIYSLKMSLSPKVAFEIDISGKHISIDNLNDFSQQLIKNPKLADGIIGNKKFLIWLEFTDDSVFNEYQKQIPSQTKAKASKILPYVLSPQLGYIGLDGNECNTLPELGQEFANYFFNYMKILKNKSSRIFDYLQFKGMNGEVEYFNEVFDVEGSSVKPGIYNEYIAMYKIIKGCGFEYGFYANDIQINHPDDLLKLQSKESKELIAQLDDEQSLFFAWVSTFFHEYPLNNEENFYIYYLEDYDDRLKEFVAFLRKVNPSNSFVERYDKATSLASKYRTSYSRLNNKVKNETILANLLPVIFAEVLIGYTLIFKNIDLPSSIFSLGSWYFLVCAIGFAVYYFFAFSKDSDFTFSTGCIGAPIIGIIIGVIGYSLFHFIILTPVVLAIVLGAIYFFIYLQLKETKLELTALVEKLNTTSDVSEIDSLIFRYTFKRISKFDVSKSEYLQGVEDELGTTRLSLWVFSGVYCVIILLIIILLIFHTPNFI